MPRRLDERLDVEQYLTWMALMTFVESGDYVDEAWFFASSELELAPGSGEDAEREADAIGSASRRTSGTRTTRSSRATTTERTRWRTRAGCCTARRRTSTACC